mgnify:FL=1
MINKVDGITLLQMIKDGKIKENTLIEVSGGFRTHHPYIRIESERKIPYWLSEDEKVKTIVYAIDLLEFEFEIIEEIEKQKVLEKIELDDNCFIDYDETGRHFINTNRKDRNIYMPRINWLIDKVDYLLKKEDD